MNNDKDSVLHYCTIINHGKFVGQAIALLTPKDGLKNAPDATMPTKGGVVTPVGRLGRAFDNRRNVMVLLTFLWASGARA